MQQKLRHQVLRNNYKDKTIHTKKHKFYWGLANDDYIHRKDKSTHHNISKERK